MIAKRIGGTLVNGKLFVVDDQNLTGYVQTLEEWTADGYDPVELSNVYDYGLDLVSQTRFEWDAQTSSLKPHTSYLIYDGHGSVRALADETGTITDTYTYDAFGIQLSQTGSTDNAYRYCGEYYDSDLGLYYLRARHMNPETGRFHTLDTYEGRLGEPLSLHKYMYAHANPVMGFDPSGHFTLAGVMQIPVIIGILSSIHATVSVQGIAMAATASFMTLYWYHVWLEAYLRGDPYTDAKRKYNEQKYPIPEMAPPQHNQPPKLGPDEPDGDIPPDGFWLKVVWMIERLGELIENFGG
jgi:RHS repeat-associated protein